MTGIATARIVGGITPPTRLFEQIGMFLAKNHLSPDPVHYAFAYHVVSDPAGALAQAVDALTEGGFCLTRQDIERMGGSAVSGSPLTAASAIEASDDTGPAAALLARTQVQADGLADTMRAIHDETRGFGRDLAERAAAMRTVGSAGGIDDIARLTGAMIERVRHAEARLKAATHEADELRTALDEARGSARVDPLTALPNRRAFDEAFAAIPRDVPCALAICDIDHFKSVNDRFGHGVGDRVLKAIGQALAADFGDQFVARYGGEEFVVLMIGVEEAQAAALVDRARDRIATKRFRLRDTDTLLGSVTFSAGVSGVISGEPSDAALGRADAALYVAKAAGRNTLKLAPTIGG